MPREDETEVVDGSLAADDDSVTQDSDKSVAYTDTEVTESERSIRFWNTFLCSDSSLAKERKFKLKIHIVGHGIDTESNWVEHEYTSPLTAIPISPDKTFNVPDLELSEYNFDVSTPYELYEKQSGVYNLTHSGESSSETATVDDSSVGG